MHSVVTPRTILDFWYSERVQPLWFRSTPRFDSEVRERFLDTWLAAAEEQLEGWGESAEGAVALAIVLDQFPLNMFRNKPLAFSTEAHARKVARRAIDAGLDAQLPSELKVFLYMPFMHSEELADQDRSVALYEAAGMADNVRFANHHRDIVRRFGRFPHRNDTLGRSCTPKEVEYINSKGAFHG